MDPRLKYEQTIAGKLQSLPLPDMEDAIWARIQGQLDIDLPTDEGGADLPKSPSGPGSWGWGLSMFFVALVASFFLFKKPSIVRESENQQPPSEQLRQPAEQAQGPPGKQQFNRKMIDDAGSEIPGPAVAQPKDSVAGPEAGTVKLPATDSLQIKPQEPVLTANAVKDSLPPVKKGKGVSGLKNDDYRIVPKKDN